MPFSLASSLFAGVLAAAFGAASPQAVQPIHLVAEPKDGGVHLRVIGSAQAPFEALYTLEVESDSGNRSIQRGQAALVPGETVTLISVRLGTSEPGSWQARLRVEPAQGEAYQEVRSSL